MRNKIILLLGFLSIIIYAQSKEDNFITGNLKTDFNNFCTVNTTANSLQTAESEKSLFLAGLFSAIIPGAGEIYSESYLKAGIFLLVEGVSWYLNLSYMKKGDDQTNTFQNYANQYWDVTRYARWINTYKAGSITINPDETLKPYQRVNWDELNAAESKIPEFSHKLAQYEEQQYFEMIGKYRQFVSGWKEYNGSSDYYNNVPDQMNFYAGERGKANDLYNIAYKATALIIVNHLLSIADAIWSANSYNSRFSTDVSLEKINLPFYSEYYPQLNIKMSF